MAKKKEAPVEREEMDIEHAEPRVYELGFHIDPELSVEDVKKVYAGLRSVMEKAGAIVAEGEPQKIQLAYTVSRSETGGRRDFDTSYFAWIAYETTGEGHAKVAETVREESRVFRFLDVLTTKEAAEHAAQLAEVLLQAGRKNEGDLEGEEEVIEAEIDQALKEVEA